MSFKAALKKHIALTVYAACVLAAVIILMSAARFLPGFADLYAFTFYPAFGAVWGRIFSLFPFSAHELILCALLLAAVTAFFCLCICLFFPRRRRRLKKIFLAAAAPFLSFALTCLLLTVLNWGINYQHQGFNGQRSYEEEIYTVYSLKSLCEMLINDLGALGAPGLDFDFDNKFSPQRARLAMVSLGDKYPALAGYYPYPKAIVFSDKMADLSLTGIFSPLTAEANYNRDMPYYLIPFTICHELTHFKGFMREDEANFAAYLACVSFSAEEFRYSGALNALSYALNALYKRVSAEEYQEIFSSLPAWAKEDLALNRAYWQKHQGAAASLSEAVNDIHLKANQQKEGIKSYGGLTALLIKYYNL